MGAIAKIKRGAKALVTRHGAEVGVCAKVAVAALMPGGGGLPEVIRAICDYVGQKDADALPDERVLELLGALKDDQTQVAVVMERLGDQLNDVMAQMVSMAHFQVPEEALTRIVEVAISTRSEVMTVRQEMMGLQADMSVIQAQNEEVLRRQRFAGDMLSQVKDSVNAALGFCAPLLSEGVSADQTHAFLQAHMTFQRCLVRGELAEAVKAFKALKGISATSDTVKVCEIALRAMRRDFEGAERVAQTLSMSARGDARVGCMMRSLSSLTQGARVITEWVLQPHLYEGISASFHAELHAELRERLAFYDNHLSYYVAEFGEAPEGPFALSVVVERINEGADGLLLWWPGEVKWHKWHEAPEVKRAIQSVRSATSHPIPTPPPVPRHMLNPLDRVESKAGAVRFFERVIPAPPNGESFLMMETQVTQALWEAVMGSNPSHFKGPRRPVEKVSWEDSVKFANALSRKLGLTPAYSGDDNNARFVEGANGFRLPLEAEWEFAARGGEGFKFAGSDHLDEVGWYRANSGESAHDDVAQLKPNAYGLYDMSGNVWEWCSDDYNNPGQYRPGAAQRVFRGGSWSNYAGCCAVTYRGRSTPDRRYYLLGLRLSRSVR